MLDPWQSIPVFLGFLAGVGWLLVGLVLLPELGSGTANAPAAALLTLASPLEGNFDDSKSGINHDV